MHDMPHTAESNAKNRAAHLGKPCPWNLRNITNEGGVTKYQCGRCRQFKEHSQFHKSKRSPLGIKGDCKLCHNAISIASRDPVRSRVRGRFYEAARRARKKSCPFTVSESDWKRLVEILGSRCLQCGACDKIEMDHIVPLSRGGSHHPRNVQPLCASCNARKHTHQVADPASALGVSREPRRAEGENMKNQTPGEKIAGVPVIGSRMWESMTSEEIGLARDLARRIDRAIRNAVDNDRKRRNKK